MLVSSKDHRFREKSLFLYLYLVFMIFVACQRGEDFRQIELDETEEPVFVDLLTDDPDLLPEIAPNGKKFRIAVVQSGEYYIYAETFLAILQSLSELGWIDEGLEFTSDEQITMKNLLDALISRSKYSDYIEFSLYFDFEWNSQNQTTEEFAKIVNDSSVSAILVFGTTAGQVLSGLENLQTPVLVFAVSDPVEAGIVASVQDSGRDNLAAVMDPERFERQVRLFYNVVEFKKLGLLYNDTPSGRSYAAWETVNRLAREKDFIVVGTTDVIEADSDTRAPDQYLKALKELAPKVDAIYLTIQAGFTLDNLPAILDITRQYGLPTFSMEGSRYVKNGVLLSISAYEFASKGAFNAGIIAQVLKGKEPRKVDTIFLGTPSIAINLKEAERISFNVPVSILEHADEIYTE